MRLILLTTLIVNLFMSDIQASTSKKENPVFSGRISKINSTAKIFRIKITFENGKFLKKNDRIELWNESFPGKKCISYLQGKTSDYLLVKIPQYKRCVRQVYFSVGTYLHMQSPDLNSNLKTARELVEILIKKKTAIGAKLGRYKREMESNIEKIDAVNKRYEILRQKLELEWQKEIADLEEDKMHSYSGYKSTQTILNELEYKLRQYRVMDQNLKEDRWSLDPKLYYTK